MSISTSGETVAVTETKSACSCFTAVAKSDAFIYFLHGLKSTARYWLSITILIVYAVFGASMYYLLENDTPLSLFDNLRRESCVGEHGFWGAMHLAATVFTSIGYGNIYPCTAGGRFFTTVYGICGIPVMFFSLDAVGKIMMNILLLARSQARRFHKLILRNRVTQIVKIAPGKNAEGAEDEDDDVPSSIGLLSTAVWIGFCVLYFSLLEGWPFLEAYYFTFVSLATIGFGEFSPSPSNFSLTVINFAFLYIGLAFVSLTINLLQRNIYVYVGLMEKKIHLQLKERLDKGAEEAISSDGFMREAKQGASIGFRLFGASATKQIQKEFEAGAKLVSKYVQATETMTDNSTDGCTEIVEAANHYVMENPDEGGIDEDTLSEGQVLVRIATGATHGSPTPIPPPAVCQWLLDQQRLNRLLRPQRPPWKPP